MKYKVRQFETIAREHIVEANSEAEAIAAVFNDETTPSESYDYVGIDEWRGMPVEENGELAAQLREHGWPCKEDWIESIASIEPYQPVQATAETAS